MRLELVLVLRDNAAELAIDFLELNADALNGATMVFLLEDTLTDAETANLEVLVMSLVATILFNAPPDWLNHPRRILKRQMRRSLIQFVLFLMRSNVERVSVTITNHILSLKVVYSGDHPIFWRIGARKRLWLTFKLSRSDQHKTIAQLLVS